MMLGTMKFWSLVFLAGTAVTTANTSWRSSEKESTFVEWPADRQHDVNQEIETLHNHSQTPIMRVFTAFPEHPSQRVWPLLKGMATRLNPLLNPHATFYLVDGVTYGCRVNHTFHDTDHCHNHCIRKGHYCAPQIPSDLPTGKYGRDVVLEVYRRICFLRHYHARGSPISFYDYMEDFETKDCLAQDNTTQCSFDSMEALGAPRSSLQKCLDGEDFDKDARLEVLDSNSQMLQQRTFREMPQVEINGEPILTDNPEGNGRKEFNADHIFNHYCNAFPSGLKPLACRMCQGCNDARTCLWELSCDGTPIVGQDPSSGSSPVSNSVGSEPTTPAGGSTQNDPNRIPESEHKETQNGNAHSNSAAKAKKEDDTEYNGMILVGVVLILVGVACPIGFYFYRDWRTKRLMSEADKTLSIAHADAEYHDNPGNDDYTEKTSGSYLDHHAGESARRGKRDIQKVDLVDLVLDGGAATSEDDDVMGEESEWAENKRANGGSGTIC